MGSFAVVTVYGVAVIIAGLLLLCGNRRKEAVAAIGRSDDV